MQVHTWGTLDFVEHDLITSAVGEKNHSFLILLFKKPAMKKTKTSLYYKVFMQVWELDLAWEFGDLLAICSLTKHGDWHI